MRIILDRCDKVKTLIQKLYINSLVYIHNVSPDAKQVVTSMSSSDQYLRRVYYDPSHPAGFGGINALYRAAKKDDRKDINLVKIKSWLQKQDTYTLHRQAPRHFKRNRVYARSIDELWQMDLCDMQSLSRYNKGFKYLLTCIDVLSKKAWAVPLKDKTGKSLVQAFQIILKDGRKPEKIQTDQGTEFTNKLFTQYLESQGIHFYTTSNEVKASVVERFNRTLKGRMYKYFTHKNTLKYVDVLDELLRSYNGAFHRSIGTAPSTVNKENARRVWLTLYGKSERSNFRFKYNVGDQVRISKSKLKFEKSYLPNYSEEIFTIIKRHARDPPVYTLEDYGGEKIRGTFYEAELQKVSKGPDALYRVEKVIRRRRRGGKTEYFVKWKGYASKYNSWVDSLRPPSR